MESTNRRVLKAIVIGPKLKAEQTTGQTKELPPDDLIAQMAADGRILQPPFDKLILTMLIENCTVMGQCVEAMEINVDGFGQRLESRVDIEAEGVPPELKAAVLAERANMINFFRYCTHGDSKSFTDMRRRTRRDIETTGEGFWEVIRTVAGKIVGFNHIPSYQIALGAIDKSFTPYQRKMSMVMPDGTRKIKAETARKRFRPFVQTRQSLFSRGVTWTQGGAEARWYKEFGDPRVIDNKTGLPVPEDLKDFPEDQKASELIHWRIYSGRTPYGMPRFIGNLITIYGDRAADEVNYVTMRNNNIPSMMIMVSNGQLTAGSIQRIEQYVTDQIQGSDNYSRFLLIEAEGQYEGNESVGNMKIDVKPLTSEQMRDQLFQEYGKNNADKIRQCWRLPPIFIGRSDDYTRATADASIKLADKQVFSPERDLMDTYINDTLMPELGVVFHDFWSNGPNVTADEDIISIMSAAESSGAMTPALGRRMVADIMGLDEHSLPPLDPSVNPHIPFTIQVAEKVKNTAEPEHQLAVKAKDQGIIKQLADVRAILDAEIRKRKRPARK